MMKISDVRIILSQMATEAEELKGSGLSTAKFKSWESKAFRRITKIYGSESSEYYSFKGIIFHKIPGYDPWDDIPDEIEIKHLNSCMEEGKLLFEGLIEEIDLLPRNNTEEFHNKEISKIFISHSSEDKKLVSEIVHLLSLIGIQDGSIFCTSLDGYGIPLGEDWLQTIKSEVSGDAIVLFVLSENYFRSAVSLCEMGAAWVLSKQHIPILIPPMDYKKMDGVIPLTQGFKIGEKHKWRMLKSKLEGLFNLTPKLSEIWESRRDEILNRIEKHLPTE